MDNVKFFTQVVLFIVGGLFFFWGYNYKEAHPNASLGWTILECIGIAAVCVALLKTAIILVSAL